MMRTSRNSTPSVPPFLQRFMREEGRRIEAVLREVLPDARRKPVSVHRAMRYAVLGSGKRLRPVLTVLAFRACGGRGGRAYRTAAAIELIHNFTLVHDDLPCMDDDRLRRGRPTVHVVFGEATALLAGDALLSLAFEVLASEGLSKSTHRDVAARIIHEVARAAGTMGVVGVQVVDIESEGKRVGLGTVRYVHTHKTGALMTCSLRVGALLGGATGKELGCLTRYGHALGLAFQIVDDIRDLKASPKELGKIVRRDRERGKATYPGLLGVEDSLKMVRALAEAAKLEVRGVGSHREHLVALADYIVERGIINVRKTDGNS